jgi:hypothetical protein
MYNFQNHNYIFTELTSFTPAWQAFPFYALRASHPWNGLMSFLEVARPQDGWPASVFYAFGHPTPYAYDSVISTIPFLPISWRVTLKFSPCKRWPGKKRCQGKIGEAEVRGNSYRHQAKGITWRKTSDLPREPPHSLEDFHFNQAVAQCTWHKICWFRE